MPRGRPRKIENYFKPITVKSKPTQQGSAGYDNPRENIDPHIKTKVINTSEGTIEGTPTKAKDIVNKAYVDGAVFSTDHDDLTNVTTSQHHVKTVSGDIDHDATINYVAKEHIDWGNATENLVTTGIIQGETLTDGVLSINGGAVTSLASLDGLGTIDLEDNLDGTGFSINANNFVAGTTTMSGGSLIDSTTDLIVRATSAVESWDVSANTTLWYKLNDDAANTDVDDEQDNYEGTLTGGDNTQDVTEAGKINAAFGLNGVDDYIATGYAPNINPSTTAFSIACWVKTTDTGTLEAPWGTEVGTNQRFYLAAENVATNKWRLTLQQNTFLYSSSTIDYGSWVFIVVTFDGAGSCEMFVDNVSQGTQSVGSYTTTGDLNFSEVGTAGVYFAGSLDNCMVFDKELSTAEIAGLWNNGDGIEALSGGGATITGTVDVGDNNLKVGGDLTFQTAGGGLPYGSIYAHEKTVTLDLSGGTYIQISGATLLEQGLTNLVTPSISGGYLMPSISGAYKVDWSLSCESATASQDIDVDIFVNDVEQADGAARRKLGSSNDKGNMGGSAIIALNANDEVNLRIKNNTGNADVIIYDCNINIMQVGA